MKDGRHNHRPLRGPGLLGIIVGAALTVVSGLVLLFGGVLFLFAAMGPNTAGTVGPLFMAAAALAMGLLRIKVSMVMYVGDTASRALCITSFATSAACIGAMLGLSHGSPGPPTIALMGLLALEVLLTIGAMFTELRSQSTDPGLRPTEADGRAE